MNLEQFIVGSIIIIIGAAAIIFRKPYARYLVSYQNKTFGFKFGESQVTSGRFVIIIVGTVSMIVGILILLGVIHQR